MSVDPRNAVPIVKAQEGDRRRRKKNSDRNRPCPCNSGKKFKRCCWSKFA